MNTFPQRVTTGVNLSLPSGALSTSLRASQALERATGECNPHKVRRVRTSSDALWDDEFLSGWRDLSGQARASWPTYA